LSYKPEPLPLDIEGMSAPLRELWERDAEDLHQAQFHSQDRALFTKFATTPARPEKGGLYYADGSTWNPGQGEGLYFYGDNGKFFDLNGGVRVARFKRPGDPDDTLSFQRAHDALPASGGVINVDPGNYVLGTVTISKPTAIIFNGGLFSGAVITPASTTGDIFNVVSSGFYTSNMVIVSTVARTSGAYLNLTNSSFCFINGFRFARPYIGIEMNGGSINTICNGQFRSVTSDSVASGGAGIYIGRTALGVANNITNVVMDTDLGATVALMPTYGIAVQSSDALIIDGCDIIRSGKALAFIPGAGQVVANGYCSNSYFDNSSYGFFAANAGTGAIVRNQFINSWTSSSLSFGAILQASAPGYIKGTTFLNHQAVLCLNSGIYVTNGNSEDTVIDGGYFAANTNNGIIFDTGCKKFTVRNVRSGASNDFTGNNIGMIIGSGCTEYRVEANNFVGNTAVGFSNSSTATTGLVIRNRGFNPIGNAAITVGTSPFTYTCGNSPETIYINGGTVTLVSINSVGMLQNSGVAIPLEPSDTVTVAYAVAPTMVAAKH
jgi:hypothetical protein